MPLGLDLDQERLTELCRRYHVAKLELFGSRAKGTARPNSDVDLLVTFEPGRVPSFLSPDGFVALNAALAEMLGQPSEILTLVRDGSAERESKKYVITNKRFDHDL